MASGEYVLGTAAIEGTLQVSVSKERVNYENLDSEDYEYVPELAEYSDEQFEALSDGFWGHLVFSKQLDQELVGEDNEVSGLLKPSDRDTFWKSCRIRSA